MPLPQLTKGIADLADAADPAAKFRDLTVRAGRTRRVTDHAAIDHDTPRAITASSANAARR